MTVIHVAQQTKLLANQISLASIQLHWLNLQVVCLQRTLRHIDMCFMYNANVDMSITHHSCVCVCERIGNALVCEFVYVLR